MAYNQFYPQAFQYQGYPYQSQIMQNPQTYQQQTQPQIQNGGFIPVKSIEEAYNWPVAPGNSVTFKVENSPYICTKTKGFSQLDQPIFEKYRLIKEEEAAPERNEKPQNGFDYEAEIKRLWDEVNSLKSLVNAQNAHAEKEVPENEPESK